MRTTSICLAIVFLCLSLFAQPVQTSVSKGLQNRHLPVFGANAFQEISRELSEFSTHHRMQTDIVRRLDSLRSKCMQLAVGNERDIPSGIQRSLSPLRKMSSPQSQIYVIDTVIIRDATDTTRHLYSFNGSAKRTSDVMQKLIGKHWVDTLRWTNTYDVSNNILSELSEYWSNGQWVDSLRVTNTYDANGRWTYD